MQTQTQRSAVQTQRSSSATERRTSAIVSALSSTSILTNLTPACAPASAANLGAIARHGPHHVAVKYASTRGCAEVSAERVWDDSSSVMNEGEAAEKERAWCACGAATRTERAKRATVNI